MKYTLIALIQLIFVFEALSFSETSKDRSCFQHYDDPIGSYRSYVDGYYYENCLDLTKSFIVTKAKDYSAFTLYKKKIASLSGTFELEKMGEISNQSHTELEIDSNSCGGFVVASRILSNAKGVPVKIAFIHYNERVSTVSLNSNQEVTKDFQILFPGNRGFYACVGGGARYIEGRDYITVDPSDRTIKVYNKTYTY